MTGSFPLSLLLPTLVAAVSTGAPAAQEREAALPGDGLERLPEGLRAQLGLRRPADSSWEGERRVARVMERLAALAETGGGDGGVAEGFVLGAPIRRSPLEERHLAPLRLLRPSEERETSSGTRARDVLGSLLRSSREFHATGVREEGELLVVELHNRGDYPIWESAWSFEGDSAVLERLELFARLEVQAQRALFRDATGALFRNETSLFQRRIAPGISHWRERLDTRLGQPLLGHAAGIAIGDVDEDGREDLYLCQPGGLPNLLLLHGEEGAVVDRSAESGADYLDFSRAALLCDLDQDGHEDLVVSVGGAVLFHAGSGKGSFELRSSNPVPSSTSLAAADYDLDGDLDVYVCAYSDPYGGGALPRPYYDAGNGQRNVLVRNEIEGATWKLVDATAAEGLEGLRRSFSFAAAWEDYDRDGDPDLYVANDFGRNNLYRNLHETGGGFLDVARSAGVEDLAAGMGVSFGDVDGDGWADLYVSNMFSSAGNRVAYERRFQEEASSDVRGQFRRHAQGNTLFLNGRNGTFTAVEAGVAEAGWAWGARFVDLNLDGWLDIVSPNGLLTQERDDDL